MLCLGSKTQGIKFPATINECSQQTWFQHASEFSCQLKENITAVREDFNVGNLTLYRYVFPLISGDYLLTIVLH